MRYEVEIESMSGNPTTGALKREGLFRVIYRATNGTEPWKVWKENLTFAEAQVESNELRQKLNARPPAVA